MSKAGHAFIKERMREEDAVYGGEMSAHHYFREFAYCDSGMIPWLLMVETLSSEDRPLSEIIQARMDRYPVSGEINRQVSDPHRVLTMIEDKFNSLDPIIDHVDGLSVEFADWRFNLRPSNTEPVIRLNVETRGDKAMLETKTDEVLNLIQGLG